MLRVGVFDVKGSNMRNFVGLLLLVAICAASSGCLRVVTKVDDLATNHDQVESFTADRPFGEVHTIIDDDATKCWSSVTSGQMMPTGSGYVVAGSGIKRIVEDRMIEPGRSATVDVVVKAFWPLPPESYILRADIKARGPSETEVTTYNADSNKGQRAFHRQVHRWVVDGVADCSGMGPFD